MDNRARRYDRLAEALPTIASRDPAAVRRRVEALERLLERGFTLPGTQRQFGLDVLLNIVPVIGPLIGTAMGALLVWEARNLGMSRFQIARMIGNIGIDSALSAIPWVGAIPDFLFRSNTRNLRIIRKHLDKHHPSTMVVDADVTRAPARS